MNEHEISLSVFAHLGVSLTDEKRLSRDRMHSLLKRRHVSTRVYKDEEEEDVETGRKRKRRRTACSEKTVVTPSARQGLVTRKQPDTPFHKSRPSSINNVEGS